MKVPARHRCLSVATLSMLLAVTVPAPAQEEAPPTESPPEAAPLRRLFVSDKLVLNVYSEPEQAGSRVATIETGDAVDEVARGDSYVRIRLVDGREGWVGSNYLTSDAPAVVQLRDLQRQQKGAAQTVDKKAADEIARLKKENDTLQAQAKELKAAAAATPAVADEGVLEGASPGPQLAAVAPSGGGSTWMWSLIVAVAAGLAYAAGYQTLARRIRKKFGGLRVY